MRRGGKTGRDTRPTLRSIFRIFSPGSFTRLSLSFGITMSVKRARINSVRPELPTPAPVRVVADQSRIEGVLRCYAAWELAEFHHAGQLGSYEADADAVYKRVVRAWSIVRFADRELLALISAFDRTANYPPVNEEVVAYRATVR